MVAALALAVAPGFAAAADSPPDSAGRFEFRTTKLEGETHRYAVWLPPGYSREREWPAIVFLHGSGECGLDGEKPVKVGLGPALGAHPRRWPFVVVFPQKPREDEEWEERESLVLQVLDRARREFRIARERVALAGISQGGHGAWAIGARHPDRWSALVPVCGYGRWRTIAPRVATLPVWAFHGLRDDLILPDDSRQIVERLVEERRRLGLPIEGARLTLYPDANHNSWDPAFAEAGLPAWILEAGAGR